MIYPRKVIQSTFALRVGHHQEKCNLRAVVQLGQVATPRLLFQAVQSLINRPGLNTLPAAIHYGRGAIDQMKVYNFEMYFRVDPDFRVPFDAWNAAAAVVKPLLVESGRCGAGLQQPPLPHFLEHIALDSHLEWLMQRIMQHIDAHLSLHAALKYVRCSYCMKQACLLACGCSTVDVTDYTSTLWPQQCTKYCNGGAVHEAKLGADEPSLPRWGCPVPVH